MSEAEGDEISAGNHQLCPGSSEIFYVPCVRRFFLALVALDPAPFVLDETTLVELFVLLVFFDAELKALVPLDFLDAIVLLH